MLSLSYPPSTILSSYTILSNVHKIRKINVSAIILIIRIFTIVKYKIKIAPSTYEGAT
jgi:hypothetical protein